MNIRKRDDDTDTTLTFKASLDGYYFEHKTITLDSIRRAMEGVAGAYFVYPIPAEGLIDAAAFTAQAAIEAGVQSLVDMSQISARREAKSHAASDHWLSERVFDWSGIPTTHLRPTFFAEWFLYQWHR